MKDMVGSEPNGGATRRLPSWMLAPKAEDAVSKSGNRINEVEHLDNGEDSESRATRKRKSLDGRSKDKPVIVAEGGRRRGKRKTSLRDAGSDFEITETAAERKESKRGAKRVRESAPRGGRRRKQITPVAEDDELSGVACAGGVGDDLELTVEDLMSIANEYISITDGDLKEPKVSRRKSGNEISTTEGSKMQVDPLDDIISGRRPPPPTILTSQNPNGIVTTEDSVIPIARTGDPAQDMLNLLLGPLLKKPANEEKPREPLPSHTLLTEEVSQSHTTSVNPGTVSLPKKKVSLKEKISKFFE